ncbi:uncharacterized protein LOC142238609 [Haematobia irritans]|uniref:uncharacterized protein LOC142238609 n=1 Tax=Haematobia irritans TaxID=7368 RepID=UPI003F505DA2
MAFAGIFFLEIEKVLHSSKTNISEKFSGDDYTSAQKNSSSENDISSGSSQTDDSNEYTEAQYPGILESDLTALTNGQKHFFITTVSILCIISIIGNVSTLAVNVRRKIRPFFRACLISLAFSDLMNTVFLSAAYLSQFKSKYVQIWILGPLMCNFVPFATTAAILASSMTLVGIALDRYYAVMKAVVSFWKPTVISCSICMLCIWVASIGITCPVFKIYHLMPVYILTDQPETDASGGETASTSFKGIATAAATDRIATKTQWDMDARKDGLAYTLLRTEKLVNMCVSDERNVTFYYVIVFVIIFIPCIGAFFWFNTIIARKLWKRRHSATITRKPPPKQSVSRKTKSNIKVATNSQSSMELQSTAERMSSTLGGNSQLPPSQNCNCTSGQCSSSTTPSGLTASRSWTIPTNPASNIPGNSRNTREARHLRMFTIILLMMVVFVFLRLPAWIFLLMRMYGSYSRPVDWILYFVFGIMNLTSSVLNPLFYTFLSETILYASRLKAKVKALLCCCSGNGNESAGPSSDATMSNIDEPSFVISCCENFCGCSGFLRATWQCHQLKASVRRTQSLRQTLRNDCNSKQNDQVVYNNEKDEGVDCSDINDDDEEDRIYTIYPSSLVSTMSQ